MRSILMNAWSVRAILEGRKTQTRRIMKVQPVLEDGVWRWKPSVEWDVIVGHINAAMSPYGVSHLWVREGYQIRDMGHAPHSVWVRYLADAVPCEYRETLTDAEWTKWTVHKYPYRASPGMFMYRSLSRITLEVLSVRVEQIQDITEEDAIKEGERPVPTIDNMGFFCARGRFQDIWNDIHKRDGYDFEANPWVWVIEFKVMSPGDI